MLENFYLVTKALQPMATVIISMMAVLGFLNTRLLWKQTNRPIVSALVETNTSGNMGIFFDLVVINSGNRPAIDINLSIDSEEEFNKCIKSNNSSSIKSVRRCFDENPVIPLLINGEKTSNFFESTHINSEQNFWNYGSSFSMTINYQDLERKKYQSKITLYVKSSEGFAGSFGEIRQSCIKIINL